MLKDVRRLIETHETLSNGALGRRGLGHITRGGVLFLCAAWELYLEEVLIEAVSFACFNVSEPKDLPKEVQKSIASYISESKHELKALALAGDGWRDVYKEAAKMKINAVNTPKPGVIDPIFRKFLGIEKISSCWRFGEDTIKDFVTARGDIAHRGLDAGYVKIGKLRNEYLPRVNVAVVDTDNYISDHLVNIIPNGQRPWNRRAVT